MFIYIQKQVHKLNVSLPGLPSFNIERGQNNISIARCTETSDLCLCEKVIVNNEEAKQLRDFLIEIYGKKENS